MDLLGCAGKSKYREHDEDKTAYQVKTKESKQTVDVTESEHKLQENEDVNVNEDLEIPFWLVDPKEVDRIMGELRKGSSLYKVKSPTKLLQRRFYLDTKNMIFYYEGSQKTFRSANTEVKVQKIREIREGEKDFSKKLQGLDKSKCFAVVMSGDHKIVYLMAPHQEVRDMWIRGMRYAMQMDRLEEQRSEMDKWIRDAFNLADKNGDGTLDLNEIMKLLKTLNADIRKKYVQKMFEAADTNRSSGQKNKLDRDEFVKFYRELTQRQELDEVFLRYSRGKAFFTVQEFLSFLKDAQKMKNVDEETCRQLIQVYEPTPSRKQQQQLSDVGFRLFLTNKKEQMFNPKHNNVYQDMTKPMTHYFIASSHNTYLTDDQLRGPSKVEAYITALKRGCRCVELDCWDGPDNEPIIYHGYTLTSKILFEHVIQAVKEYAFIATPYPLILSLENHCSVEQQKVMAQHMKAILGDMIFAPEEQLKTAPSPEELKMKIILKGKTKSSSSLKGKTVSPKIKRKRISSSKTKSRPTSSSSSPKSRPTSSSSSPKSRPTSASSSPKSRATSPSPSPSPKGKKLPPSQDTDDVSDEDEAQETENTDVVEKPDKKSKIKLAPELSRITAMKSVSFKDWEQAANIDNAFCIFSLGESKTEKLIQSQASGLNVVTQTKLIRTYPAGSRTDSSNYNPISMWNHGCQVVALNYQTGSEPMQLYCGKFLDNGSSGYVLKPSFLMSDKDFGIVNKPELRKQKQILTIHVISGYQIPKPKLSTKGEVIDPFVKVEIHGVQSDNKEQKTKTINNNGFNPIWKETFTFDVEVPELAVVRFVVKDEDRGIDDFVGFYSLPFTSIQQGYRHFPLFDKRGEQLAQTLIFVHIKITRLTKASSSS